MHLRSLIFAAVIASAQAAATPVKITFSGSNDSPVDVQATRGELEKHFTCDTIECVVDLAAGDWTLRFAARKKWLAPQSIVVGDAPLAVTANVFDEGALTGRIQANEKLPDSIGVTFEAEAIPHVEVQCPVHDGRWTCAAPATVSDVRLHIPGFVSRYVWGAHVNAGKTTDVGTQTFKRGASLIGSVALARGLRANLSESYISLRAAGDVRNVPSALRVHPRPNGFFQFDGVPPGQFELVSTLRNMTSDTRRITIIDGYEAQLRTPLLLDTPKHAEILISPPLDPWMKPWSVDVFNQLQDGHWSSAGGTPVMPDGRWSSPPLRSGGYKFAVNDHSGNLWATDEARIDGADINRTILVPVTALTGAVRLGEKPIAADLTFDNGSSSIRFRSDDDGTFRGFIVATEDPKWSVRVESRALFIKRTIPELTLTKRDERNELEASISLPATRVGGVIVGEDGGSVPRAIVEVSQRDGSGELVQTQAMNGVFTLNGVEPGEYLIRAESYDLRASDAMPIRISDSGTDDDIRLVVKPKHEIQVSVDSPAGPIPAAKVWLIATDRPASISYPVTTDAGGMATALLPPGSRAFDVKVDAPGFTVDQFHVEFERARLAIHMEQNGGQLRLALPPPKYEAEARQALLIHKGAVFSAYSYGAWTADGVMAPDVDPGVWTLCLVSPADRAAVAVRASAAGCATGTLASHGTLTLTAQ